MRTKLNIADKNYLLENRSQPLDKLSADLDLSSASIEKFFSENPKPKEETAASKLLARNEKYGVVMMTEETSEIADDKKSVPSKKNEDHIFRFK